MIKISNTDIKEEDLIVLNERHPIGFKFLKQIVAERKRKSILKQIESEKKTIATSKKVIKSEKKTIAESESEISRLEKKYNDLVVETLDLPINQSQQVTENNLSEFTTTNKIIVDSIKQKASSRVNMLCECQRQARGLEQQDPIILGQCCSGYSEQTYSREKNEEYININ